MIDMSMLRGKAKSMVMGDERSAVSSENFSRNVKAKMAVKSAKKKKIFDEESEREPAHMEIRISLLKQASKRLSKR